MSRQINLFRLISQDTSKVDDQMLENILDANAAVADLELNNNILKELVCSYAALEKKNFDLMQELQHKTNVIMGDLAAAAIIQETLLPTSPATLENYKISWKCLPCEKVGGDLVKFFDYDNEHLVFYIIDVSGHGPRAAMITVALSQVLSPNGPRNKRKKILSPAAIFAELELEFPFARFNSLFTIVYGVLNHKTGKCTLCNSAHPSPILVDSNKAQMLDENNPMIGLNLVSDWVETTIDLGNRQKLLLYTDGVFECRNADNQEFGEKALFSTFTDLCSQNNPDILKDLSTEVANFCEGRPFADDYSLMLIESLG